MPRDFEEFFVESEPILRAAFVARFGLDLGREVTAEALAWAFENWGRTSAMQNPRGYLFRVGQSRARALRRHHRSRPLDSAPPLTSEPIDLDLHAALDRLSPRQRVAVVLHHCMDLTLVDTAAVMGVSAATVQRHLDRGLVHLRTHLGSSYDDQLT